MSRFRLLLAESPAPARLVAMPAYPWMVVGTVCVGAFLGQLDASIASLVLPTLEEVFHAPIASVEWVALVYLLTLAALVVPLGRVADLVGRKMLYTWGFLVFVAGSFLCGMAPSLDWLIAFRAMQAVGAAMLQANSVAIITAVVPRRLLGRAIGIQGAAQAVGLSIGPSVGGFLIDALGWQWVFFIAVPFGLVGTILGRIVLPPTDVARVRAGGRKAERFDWMGALLLGPSIAFGLLALSFGNAWGWTDPRLLAVAVAALVSFVAFLVAERKADWPLLDLELFRARLFSLSILAGLLSYAVLFGALFVMPFYLERILGASPARAGLLLTPVPIMLGLSAPLAGLLADRRGSRLPTFVGMGIATAALVALVATPADSLVLTLVEMGLLGLGLGLFTPANNSAAMSSAAPRRLGVAGGVLNMTRSLGMSLGVAATGALLTWRLEGAIGQQAERTVDAAPALLQPAFHETLLFLAGLSLLAAVISTARGTPDAAPRESLLREQVHA